MAADDELKSHLDYILLQVANAQNIINYELKPNTDTDYGDGLVAQFFTGEVQNKDTGEITSVAIKKAPVFMEHGYKDLFSNENLFYKIAFPALDNFQKETNVLQPFDNVPSYFCGSVAEPKKEYIAMEFLKPFGYVMSDKKKAFDQEHLEFIFKTYGKYHALSSVLRKKSPKLYEDITKEMVDVGETMGDVASPLIIMSVSAAVKALDEEKYKAICDELQNFGENAAATFRKSFEYNGEHRCLVHGDCWSNNMLFKYSKSGKLVDIKLLDFQLCRDSSPIHDLSYFFYSGAAKKDFDNIEYYLKIYYNSFFEFSKELGANSDEIITFEDLVNEWKENALLGVIFGIWLWQIKLTPKEDFNKLFTDKGKGASEEEMNAQWMGFMNKVFGSTVFKENSTSILIHAYEYGILNKDKIVQNK